jgi:hypothetical protein
MSWKKLELRLLITLILSGCATRTPDQIARDAQSDFLFMPFAMYVAIYVYCRFATFASQSIKLTLYGRVFVCCAALCGIIFYLSLQPVQTSYSWRGLLFAALLVHISVFVYTASLIMDIPARLSAWLDNRQERQEDAKRSALQKQAAEHERQAKQAFLEEHSTAQAQNLRAHKHRMAAKHISELTQHASALDGAEDDKAILDLILLKGAAFLEEPELVDAIKADKMLQSELNDLLREMRRFGHRNTAAYKRLSRLRA